MAKRKKAPGGTTRRGNNANGPEGYERVPVTDLCFDPDNPRLVEYVAGDSPNQRDLLRVLWQQMAVDELAMSIAASGYIDHEPLLAISENGRLVVIEGNRRLAAVKLLLDKTAREELRATDLPRISTSEARQLETLPIIRTTREDAWRYLGFKHVNGPAKWDSYAKAQCVAQVHNGFDVPLVDIASQIGDKHNTVQRMYRALMVIEQAEAAGVFQRSNRFKSHFSFSHLYTGLDYDGISSFVRLKDESAESKKPVPKSCLGQLGELCSWLYGDRALEQPPVVESQNPHLRQLDEVLKSSKATSSLRAGLPLGVALEVSYGDERVFQNALIKAKEQLQKAHATMTTGFHGEEELQHLANDVSDLAYDLAEEMERKAAPRRRKSKKGQS